MVNARHGLGPVQVRNFGIERLNNMILPLYSIQRQRITDGSTHDIRIVVLKIEMSKIDRSRGLTVTFR